MQRLPTWQLFVVCVLVWSTTWHAITYQIGHTTPEVGVTYRFTLAGLLVLGWCLWRGISLRFSKREHALIALQGVLLYSLSYLCVYHGEQYLASGLVAVGYSASPLINGLGAWVLFGIGLSRRFIAGGLLAMLGVSLIFWPEFEQATGSGTVALGATFTIGAVLLSSGGNLAATYNNRQRPLPFWPALGWGMLYGGLASAIAVLAAGQSFVLPTAVSWWASLLYLSVFGSVLAFACYLTVLHRIGPGPSATIGVMTTLLALVVSLMFEGYVPNWLTLSGAALAVLGNVLMLRK